MRLEEARELLPLYALHALPEDEVGQLEQALQAYPELWPELKALQATAADLTYAVPERAADADLKAKVLARVRSSPTSLPKAVEPRVLTLPSQPRVLWSRWAASFAAVAAVLLLVWGGVQVYPWMEWARAARNPQAKMETLVNEKNQPVGRAILLPGGRTLVWTQLPPPPPGKTYQLWGVNQTDHVGLNTYRGGLIAFNMPQGYPIVHITEEKMGGSPTPTQIRAFPQQE
ncbi:MAG: anti-sigma factor [Thermaceae bacterium]|nr:anti-sigma factor [Thermaceae bacterium]